MKKTLLNILVIASIQPLAAFAAETPSIAPEPAASPAPTAQVAPPSLEDQLQSLGTPGNEAPAGLTSEKLYAVQTRFSGLKYRSELSLGLNNNFSTSSFLSSQSIDATYRFYLSNRWYLGLSGNYVFNGFSRDGEKLITDEALVPDVSVTKYRADLLLGYNLFYGKFRASMDTVFYFDQYVGIGPGVVWQQGGRRFAAVADAGFAFWFGRNFSTRLGVKDYFYDEQRLLSHGLVHNFVGYFQAGYVFGGG